jgi:hypothetical protein
MDPWMARPLSLLGPSFLGVVLVVMDPATTEARERPIVSVALGLGNEIRPCPARLHRLTPSRHAQRERQSLEIGQRPQNAQSSVEPSREWGEPWLVTTSRDCGRIRVGRRARKISHLGLGARRGIWAAVYMTYGENVIRISRLPAVLEMPKIAEREFCVADGQTQLGEMICWGRRRPRSVVKVGEA